MTHAEKQAKIKEFDSIIQHLGPAMFIKHILEINDECDKMVKQNKKLKEQLARLRKTTSKTHAKLFKDFELVPSRGYWKHKTSGEVACPKCKASGELNYVSKDKDKAPGGPEKYICLVCGLSFDA